MTRRQYAISRFCMLNLKGEHGTPARRTVHCHQRGIVRRQQPPYIRSTSITTKARSINRARQDHGATGPGSDCRL